MSMPAAPPQPSDTAAPARSSFGRPTSILARGVTAGIVAATVMAAWFMLVDSSEGSPFRTPNFLAGSLLGLDGMQMGVGPILLYTAIHYGVWIVVGCVAARSVSRPLPLATPSPTG